MDPTDEQSDEGEQHARLIEIDDFKWLMGCPQGRRFVWRLLEGYGVFLSSFSTDPLEMAFREGRRNEGLRLMAMIHEHTPDRYIELLKEQKDAARAGQQRSPDDARDC